MTNHLDLSAYELGVINNALRNKVIRLEAEKKYETVENFEENKKTDIFCSELLVIKEKVRQVISEKESE